MENLRLTWWKGLGLVLIFALTYCVPVVVCDSLISMDGDGGYTGIVVAISPELVKEATSENGTILPDLKKLFEDTSNLLNKTQGAWHFKDVTFLLPPDVSWIEGVEDILTFETYRDADIRVEVDTGFTTDQFGGCGKPGDAIYVDWKPKENAAHKFLQQWAKFRYGVFDEYNEKQINEGLYPDAYIDSNGDAQKSGCTEKNKWIVLNDTCRDDLSSCKFTAKGTDVKFSLMDNVKASEFCEKNEERGDHSGHNSLSPTPQNAFCDGMSTWEVIKMSDNADDAKPPRHVGNTELRFKYVSAKRPPTAIVVDQPLCTDQDLPMALGKLWFHDSSASFVEATLIMPGNNSAEIDSGFTPENLTDAIKKCKEVKTSNLNESIAEGLKVLKNGGHLIVLVEYDSLKTVSQLLPKKKYPRLRTFVLTYQKFSSISNLVNINLKDMPPTKWYNIAPSYKTGDCNVHMWKSTEDVFFDIFERHQYTDYERKITQVYSGVHENGAAEGKFTVSSGSVVCLTVHCCKHCLSLALFIDEVEATNWTFTVANVHEQCVEKEGTHTYRIEEPTTATPFFLTIREKAAENKKTDHIDIRTVVHPVQVNDLTVHVVYAIIRHKGRPVNNADVTAVLRKPGLRDQKFELLDSGNGDPDIFAQDGIYSRYIIPRKYEGIYDISVEVKHEYTKNKPADIIPAGSVIFPNSLNSSILPPSRIVDLQLERREGNNVTLQWSVPGEDLDQGKAEFSHLNCTATSDSECNIFLKKIRTSETPTGQRHKEFIILRCRGQVYICSVIAEDAHHNRCDKPSNFVTIRTLNNSDSSTIISPTNDPTPTTTTENVPIKEIIIGCSAAVSGLLLILIVVLLIIHREKLPCCKSSSPIPAVAPSNGACVTDTEKAENPKPKKLGFFSGKTKETKTAASKTDGGATSNRVSIIRGNGEEDDIYMDPESIAMQNARAKMPMPIQKRPPIQPPPMVGEAYDEVGHGAKRPPASLPPRQQQSATKW